MIPAKKIRQADLWFAQGELSRRVLDALRRAGFKQGGHFHGVN